MLRDILASKGVRYLRAAYYFGDCAPYTCWDGFRPELVDVYLEKVKADGFNCIIVLVPGSIPEIEVLSPKAADFFWQCLSGLMEKARTYGLFVLLRLNYIWDRFPVRLDRYRLTLSHHLPGDERNRLCDFLSRLHVHCEQHENFLYGFITWEDATMYLIDHLPKLDPEERTSIAGLLGYTSSSRHDGPEIVPKADDPDFKNYLEFVDDLLVGFYKLVRSFFPRLSMEVRCDFLPYWDIQRKLHHHYHLKTYSIEGMDIIGTYYAIYMGAANNYEQLSAADAFRHFETVQRLVLSSTSCSSRPLVFVDQFLFCIREREFSHFAWMDEKNQSLFIEMCAEWMRDHSAGYAVWSFQDYLTDQIANSGFSLGLDGWERSGPVMALAPAGPGCVLKQGGAVWQLLSQKLLKGFTIFEIEPIEDAEIEFSYAQDTKELLKFSLSEGHRKAVREFQGEAYFLRISVKKGSIKLFKASIGAEIASHGAYSIDFAETATTAALTKLNKILGPPSEEGYFVDEMAD